MALARTFRHTVFVWLRPEVSDDEFTTILTKLQALRQNSELRLLSYSGGQDEKLAEGNPSFVISAEFASVEDYKHYAQHPAHQEFLTYFKSLMVPDRPPIRAQYWVNHFIN